MGQAAGGAADRPEQAEQGERQRRGAQPGGDPGDRGPPVLGAGLRGLLDRDGFADRRLAEPDHRISPVCWASQGSWSTMPGRKITQPCPPGMRSNLAFIPAARAAW